MCAVMCETYVKHNLTKRQESALVVKYGENSAASKQSSGDGHQWQQLRVQNTRVHFAEYFRLMLKLSKTIYNSGNQCVHLNVSYVGGSS